MLYYIIKLYLYYYTIIMMSCDKRQAKRKALTEGGLCLSNFITNIMWSPVLTEGNMHLITRYIIKSHRYHHINIVVSWIHVFYVIANISYLTILNS